MSIKYDLTSHVLKKPAKCMRASFMVYQVQYKKQTYYEAPVKTADFKKGRSNNFFPILAAGQSLQITLKRGQRKY